MVRSRLPLSLPLLAVSRRYGRSFRDTLYLRSTTMNKQNSVWKRSAALVGVCAFLSFGCCDDNSPADETGTTLQGTVTAFQAQVVSGGFELAWTEGVTVAIGSKSTQTDANGDFTLRDFGVGTQNVLFSRDGGSGTYVLTGIERGDAFLLDLVEISGNLVATQHTGTWIGTGGSTDPGSQGQVALTMIIAQNGNALTGTASIGEPDNTSWNISGMETGHTATGLLTVTTTNSACAAGGDFTGTFVADTLSGSFIEVDVPAGCGTPEPGIFRVVKQ